ncbi:MAG: restriction endonuclease [Gammaproteobacteria bacterium]|nr:restriction endonuclease [Gammaproteobacteria bacterium]
MGRRKNSLINDLFEVTASLPWWAGVLLAGFSYAFLHALAGPSDMVSPKDAADIGHAAGSSLLRVVAGIGQYALPTIFAFAAVASFLKRRRSKKVLEAASSLQAVRDLSWQDFERLIGEAFRQQGYNVAENGGGGPDGGVDLVLRKDGESYLVQCKHWRALKVGVPVVRELFGAMTAKGAVGGFLVTSGKVTTEGKAFAEGRNLTIIEGDGLGRMLGVASWISPSHILDTGAPGTASRCPKCGSEMVLRTAKKGANAGFTFLGCTRFPQCRGTRQA